MMALLEISAVTRNPTETLSGSRVVLSRKSIGRRSPQAVFNCLIHGYRKGGARELWRKNW